jgi:hypothetical protein
VVDAKKGRDPVAGPLPLEAMLLLPRHREVEALLRGDQVIVVVLLQVDLDPV